MSEHLKGLILKGIAAGLKWGRPSGDAKGADGALSSQSFFAARVPRMAEGRLLRRGRRMSPRHFEPTGIASEQREGFGWTTVVRHALRPDHLTLVGPTTLSLSLPAVASYDLVAAETLAVHVPSAALISGVDVDVDAELEVSAVPGTSALSGYIIEYDDANEAAVQWGVASRWDEPQARP